MRYDQRGHFCVPNIFLINGSDKRFESNSSRPPEWKDWPRVSACIILCLKAARSFRWC